MNFSAKILRWIDILFQPLCYYCAWYIAVVLSAHNKPWQATGFASIIAIAQIAQQMFKKNNKNGLLAAFFLALTGIAVDSIYVTTGIINLNANPFSPYFAAPWLMAIWFNFAIIFFSIGHFFDGKPVLLGLLSLIGFPLAYYAGAMMGAIHFNNPIFSMLIVGITWLIVLPEYTWLSKKVFKGLACEWEIKSKN